MGGGGVHPKEPVFCCFLVDWPKSGSIRHVQNSLNFPSSNEKYAKVFRNKTKITDLIW